MRDPLPPKVRADIEAAKAWDRERRARLTVVAGGDEVPPAGPPTVNLPTSFYDERPWLAHVRQAAHARMVSADAVLAFVLARVCALTPPTLVLPDIVGGYASLNFYAVVIGGPGVGKSSSLAVARALVPIKDSAIGDALPLGSGEGLIESFFDYDDTPGAKGKKVRARSGSFFYLDEGGALADMTRRQGSTLMPTVRAAWTGGVLGQMNASEATRRMLDEHSYRLTLVIGAQYPVAAAILDEANLGTPQRFEWASAVDPSLALPLPAFPGPLAFTPPARTALNDVPILSPLKVDPSVRVEIEAARLASTTGVDVIEELDGHALLARLKVAALFAVVEGRHDVTPDDWRLAALYRETSVAMRQAVVDRVATQAALNARKRHRAVAAESAYVEGEAERRALEGMARAMAAHCRRHVREVDGCTRRCLTLATPHRQRVLCPVDEALEHAVQHGWLRRVGNSYLPGET